MFSALKNLFDPTLRRRIIFVVRTSLQSLAYFPVRNRNKAIDVRHIVFVCKGNVCRSSFAEYYFKTLSLQPYLKIESCGLDVDQSVCSPADACSAAAKFKVDLTENRSKGLGAIDLERADLIVAMEYNHFKRLVQKYPHKKNQIHLLRDFAPWPKSLPCNIHDPYGCSLDEFRACFTTMKQALDSLAGQVAQDHRRQ